VRLGGHVSLSEMSLCLCPKTYKTWNELLENQGTEFDITIKRVSVLGHLSRETTYNVCSIIQSIWRPTRQKSDFSLCGFFLWHLYDMYCDICTTCIGSEVFNSIHIVWVYHNSNTVLTHLQHNFKNDKDREILKTQSYCISFYYNYRNKEKISVILW